LTREQLIPHGSHKYGRCHISWYDPRYDFARTTHLLHSRPMLQRRQVRDPFRAVVGVIRNPSRQSLSTFSGHQRITASVIEARKFIEVVPVLTEELEKAH